MSRKTKTISWIRSRALPLAGGLLLLCAAVAYGLYLDRHATVEEYRFTGLDRIAEDELREMAPLPTGQHPDSLDIESILTPLRAHPWLEELTLRPQAGGRIVLDLTEREPIALLITSSGRCYMDRNGMRMDLRGAPENVPLVHGFACRTGTSLEGRAFEEVRDFLTTMQQDPLSWHTLSEVSWNRDEGVIALTQENGVKVLFGRGDFERKQSYWSRFYQEVVTQEGIGSFRTVDLRFRGQIVTQKT